MTLRNALHECTKGIVGSLSEINSQLSDLDRKMGQMEVGLEYIHSRIGCTKMERMVEEQVDSLCDIFAQKKAVNNLEGGEKDSLISREVYEQRVIATISCTIRKAFDHLESMSPNVDAASLIAYPVDPTTSNPLGNTKDAQPPQSLLNILPPIIGTAEFVTFMRERTQHSRPAGTSLLVDRIEAREEDRESTSSAKSVPPQDPVVIEKIGFIAELIDKNVNLNSVGTSRDGNNRAMETNAKANNISAIQQSNHLGIPIKDSGHQKAKVDTEDKLSKIQIPARDIHTYQQQVDAQNQLFIAEGEADKCSTDIHSILFDEAQHSVQSSTYLQSLIHSAEILQQPIGNIDSPETCLHKSTLHITKKNADFGKKEIVQRVRQSLFCSSSDEEELTLKNNCRKQRIEKKAEEEAEEEKRLPAKEERKNEPKDRIPAPRPLSANSILSATVEKDQQQSRPLRKTESSVTSNEELGPATVKSRIAQIGSQIPIGGRRGGGEDDRGKSALEESFMASIPSAGTDAIKSRAKGPARRAPTQFGGSKVQPSAALPPRPTQAGLQTKEEESPMSNPSPASKPTKGRSIFSSSSSDDELILPRASKALMPTTKIAENAVPVSRQPPVVPKKLAAGITPFIYSKNETTNKQQRKGLFDDSDSDF